MKLIAPIDQGDFEISLEPVEKAISDSLFFPSMLKDGDQSSFYRISLGVCSFGRVSPL